MANFHLDEDKQLASLLYICQSLGGEWDRYSLLKILYFAEKSHLAKYGRPITGDYMVAMPHGPVPSASYDAIKANVVNKSYFKVIDNLTIKALAEPNLDCLSESDIECLNDSIAENKDLSFNALKIKSHDAAYNWTVNNIGLNSTIPFINIAMAAGASPEMLRYIELISENQKLEISAP